MSTTQSTPDLDAIEAERARIRDAHLLPAGERAASTARGLHHTALISRDVEPPVRFYQDVLGFPLTELIENRDYPGSSHFFFDIGHGNLLAFFDFPGLDVGPYAEVLGGLHHMAISVDPERWEKLVERLTEAGVPHEVHSGVSVYFRDPDGARIELIADPLGEMYGQNVLCPARMLDGAQPPRRAPARRVSVPPLSPSSKLYFGTEAGGSALLLVATVAALAWANSPWSDSYASFWHTTATIGVGDFALSLDLQHWVNDAAMALFFLVVGLEITREVSVGELRDRRNLAAPALGALGGLVVPALIYLAINPSGPASPGWGVVMSTDTAFVLGILALFGPRCPDRLRLFLLTLAIVDDIGAILVMALFYSGELDPTALGIAGLLTAMLLGLRWAGVWRRLARAALRAGRLRPVGGRARLRGPRHPGRRHPRPGAAFAAPGPGDHRADPGARPGTV